MPIHLVGDVASQSNAGFDESAATSIHIGLINNMPDAALKATERQFLTLLNSAASGVRLRLSLYALPDVPRSVEGRRHINRFYSGIENLWDSHVDGLIVTGTEPRAANLKDEPYWENFTRVLEWAEHNTHSAVWSCLAAHAAITPNPKPRRTRCNLNLRALPTSPRPCWYSKTAINSKSRTTQLSGVRYTT